MDSRYSEISDLFKEVYGYRPREETMARIDAMSKEEYEGYYESLIEDLGIAIEQEEVSESAQLKVLNERIIGMMIDYNISMVDAMAWDFESFGRSIKELYEIGGEGYVEYEFEHYLWQNHIRKGDNIKFYSDVFMGRRNNFVLDKN